MRFVVCRETRPACLHRISAFTAVFDGGFAYSGERAAAKGIFFRAYQSHQRSTMRIGKEGAANGAQQSPLTAKVHNLGCKTVPGDSSLIATKNSCNQAQIGPPTRLPNRMFHRKIAFIGTLFVHAQHLPTYPFSRHNPNQCSSSKMNRQAKNEKLRTTGYKYPRGRTI